MAAHHLATGSSTLTATARFRDTLTGRKRTVALSPVLATELPAFGADLERRLLRGGLPAVLLGSRRHGAPLRSLVPPPTVERTRLLTDLTAIGTASARGSQE